MLHYLKDTLDYWHFAAVNSALSGWQLSVRQLLKVLTDMTTIKPSGDKRTVMMYQNLDSKEHRMELFLSSKIRI